MTPTDLRLLGEALYGKHWKSPLARRLGTDHKTVWRWSVGVHRPSGWYSGALERLHERVNPLKPLPLPAETTLGGAKAMESKT